jgi:hypothetical protein
MNRRTRHQGADIRQMCIRLKQQPVLLQTSKNGQSR